MRDYDGFRIVAYDFDDTLFVDDFPNIGDPILPMILDAIQEKENGSKIILWTCRTDKPLEAAIAACKEYGLEFNAINDNVPEAIKRFGSNSRKIYATKYWDDKAAHPNVLVNPTTGGIPAQEPIASVSKDFQITGTVVMTEPYDTKTPLQAYQLQKFCPCNGELKFTGRVQETNPPRYEHRCKDCGKMYNYGITYPSVGYEPIEEHSTV